MPSKVLVAVDQEELKRRTQTGLESNASKTKKVKREEDRKTSTGEPLGWSVCCNSVPQVGHEADIGVGCWFIINEKPFCFYFTKATDSL